MGKRLVIYYILFFVFIGGSTYNFRIWKQSLYSVRLTKARVIIMILSPLIFLSIPYLANENSRDNYILSILGGIFIISQIVGVGIHEKGIYYHSIGMKFPFIKLAKWQDIKDYKLDMDKSKLISFKFKTTTIYPEQYYKPKDINGINKYLKIKTKQY